MSNILTREEKVKVRVSEIEWDTETENCDLQEGYNESLPTEVIVEVGYTCDDDDIYDAAVNAASDKEGWLIDSCSISPLKEVAATYSATVDFVDKLTGIHGKLTEWGISPSFYVNRGINLSSNNGMDEWASFLYEYGYNHPFDDRDGLYELDYNSESYDLIAMTDAEGAV